MRRSVAVVVALVSAVACSSPATRPEAVEPGVPGDAVREVRSLADEAYRNLERGDGAGMTPMSAPDIFVAGPGSADVGLERSAAAVAIGDALASKKRHKLRSARLASESAPDGHAAWTAEHVELDGQPYTAIAIGAEVDGLWTLTAVHVARAIPERKASKIAGEAPLPELPAWRAGTPPTAGNRAAPGEVLATFREAMASPEDRLAQLAGKSATFVGPGPRAVVRGAKALKKAWKKKPPTWTIADTVAGATPDGNLAWVLAHGARDGDQPQPRRLFAIYQRIPGDGGLWELVLLHEAVVPAPTPAPAPAP